MLSSCSFHLLLLLALFCTPLLCQADQPTTHNSTHDCREAAQRETEREAQERIRNVLQRDVQRAEAAHRLINSSSTGSLCPLLYYTPQLRRDDHTSDYYTLRLAHLTAANAAFTHVAFIDVHYSPVDSRSLIITGPTRTAHVAVHGNVSSIDQSKLVVSGLRVQKGQALRVLVVYRVNDRECK